MQFDYVLRCGQPAGRLRRPPRSSGLHVETHRWDSRKPECVPKTRPHSWGQKKVQTFYSNDSCKLMKLSKNLKVYRLLFVLRHLKMFLEIPRNFKNNNSAKNENIWEWTVLRESAERAVDGEQSAQAKFCNLPNGKKTFNQNNMIVFSFIFWCVHGFSTRYRLHNQFYRLPNQPRK